MKDPAPAQGVEPTTFVDRLRAFAVELMADAFLADIHNLDGRGPREVQGLTDLFERKVLDFMCREKRMERERLTASPARSEAGETQPSEDKIARALCCVGEPCVRPEDCIAKRSRLARAQTEAIRKLYASQKDKT